VTQPLSLHVDTEALRPLVREIVAEVLDRLEGDRAKLSAGRLAYSEEEAARLLGLEPHVLRDERRRGRIGASSIVGRRIRYTHDDLLAYLESRRVASAGLRPVG
jgi:helix-turn-helix protein